MIELIDLARTRLSSEDADDLRSLLKLLVNQPFIEFRVSYGDELQIHLGEERLCEHPRRRGTVMGTYVVTTRASSWSLLSGTQSVLITSDPEVETSTEAREASPNQKEIHVIESTSYIAPRSTVRAASPFATKYGFGLSLKFADSSEFFLVPSAPEPGDAEDPIADWEVLTPSEHLLKAGPGLTWSYLPDSSTSEDVA